MIDRERERENERMIERGRETVLQRAIIKNITGGERSQRMEDGERNREVERRGTCGGGEERGVST